MSINLRTCKVGQKVELRSGEIVEYRARERGWEDDIASHQLNGLWYRDNGYWELSCGSSGFDVVRILPFEPVSPNEAVATTLDLNTCVKGQKLRLRDGRIVTYNRKRLAHLYPHCTITESKECYTYTDEGKYDFSMSALDVVEILPLETNDSSKPDNDPLASTTMINLKTCVHEQKLRLRNGQIVTYDKCYPLNAYPHSVITEGGGCLSYTDEGLSSSSLLFGDLDVVEILPLETTDSPNPDNDPLASTTMINLNTCVHDQKLRLRDGRIVAYDRKRPVHPYPHCTRTESKECYTYTDEGKYHASLTMSAWDVVEILPLETTDSSKSDKHPSVAAWESFPWITDRRPTLEDTTQGEWLGNSVLTFNDTHLHLCHYDGVKHDEKWIHLPNWTPPKLTPQEEALALLEGKDDDYVPSAEEWRVFRKAIKP